MVVKATDEICEFKLYGSEGSYILTLEKSTANGVFEFSSLSVCNGSENNPGLISGWGTTDKTKPDLNVTYRYTLWYSLEDPTDINPLKVSLDIYIIHE
jgi:hypothetical protein